MQNGIKPLHIPAFDVANILGYDREHGPRLPRQIATGVEFAVETDDVMARVLKHWDQNLADIAIMSCNEDA